MASTDPPQRPVAPPQKPSANNPAAPPAEASSFYYAITSIRPSDFLHVHKLPCVREALLAGITTGFAFGGVKLILRSTVPIAANWAAGMFCGSSLVVYETCQYRRWKERRGVKRAIEIMERSGGQSKKRPITNGVGGADGGGNGGARQQQEQGAGDADRSRARTLEKVQGGGAESGNLSSKATTLTVPSKSAETSIPPPPLSSSQSPSQQPPPSSPSQSKSWYRFW